MKVVKIGKGMVRITVRSREKLEKLARVADVTVEGERVIFPEWLIPHIRSVVEPPRRRRGDAPGQADLFD